MKSISNDTSLIMHSAVVKGDLDSLKRFITNGYDINTVDSLFNSTPLHLAAKKGNISIVRELLKHNASTQVYNKSGYTPLHLACQYEHYCVVLELLKSGTQVNVRSLNNNTPLHLAIVKKNITLIKLLIFFGADIDSRGHEGYTPLILSASLGDYETTLFLLSKGADISTEMSNKNYNACKVALHKGHLEIVDLLNISETIDFFSNKLNESDLYNFKGHISEVASCNIEKKLAFIDRFSNVNFKKLSSSNLPLSKLQHELNCLYINLKSNIMLVQSHLKEDISFLENFKETLNPDMSGFISLQKMCSLKFYNIILNSNNIDKISKDCVLDTFNTLNGFKVDNQLPKELQVLLGNHCNIFEDNGASC